MLITSKTQLQLVYPKINSKIVPSLLRNFSAPVILRDDLTPSERLRLLAHDTDKFNRWDAAQTLFAEQILAIAIDPNGARNELAMSALGNALADVLENSDLLDLFKAGLLTLPTISVLESRVKPADPVALFHARRKVEAELGRLLTSKINAVLARHSKACRHVTELAKADMRKTAGGRALLNRLLSLAVANGDLGAIEFAAAQVHDQNMTLSQGAIAALNHCDHPAR